MRVRRNERRPRSDPVDLVTAGVGWLALFGRAQFAVGRSTIHRRHRYISIPRMKIAFILLFVLIKSRICIPWQNTYLSSSILEETSKRVDVYDFMHAGGSIIPI